MNDPSPDPLDSRLQERFGLPSLRPWQREVVEELLEGSGQVMAIAPTGGGKSLCYQFPATELEGTSIVISPLIALMEDQVRSLEERGIAATFLASTLSAGERRARMDGLRGGRYQLVYLAPERLGSGEMNMLLDRLKPPLIAVDEAHCISQWGHDFRPDYLRIGRLLETLRPPRVLACTATATPTVRAEILEKLGLGDDAKVVLRGFARPNLHLAVEDMLAARGRRDRMRTVLRDALGSPTKPAGAVIVYSGARKKAEELAGIAAGDGWRAEAYHAGMSGSERARVSEAFAAREVDVVVATNAFGMGIDRPDIRAVVHVQAPGSIEEYYQEVGRAGRDGQPALGLLLTGPADINLRRWLIESPDPRGQVASQTMIDRRWGLFRDLLRYIDAGSCRHDFILRYFQDEQELLGGCGHCDVCESLEEPSGEERVVDEEDALVVRKALSGVARVRLRAGLMAVAEMLEGATTAKIRKMGLDELSTHGLFRGQSKDWILRLLRRLVSAGLVDITADRFPMPYLTSAGVEVMKGDAPVRVLPPPPEVERTKTRSSSGRRAKAEPPPNMDPELFEALRGVRAALAKDQGVPAYVVCSDKTLMAIAAERPASRGALLSISGMGPARVAAYGEALLEGVAAHGG